MSSAAQLGGVGTNSYKGKVALLSVIVSKMWLPVVDAFRTFCVNPSPESSALLSGVRNLTFLGLIGQGSGQGDSGRVSR
jgi:hypothetical protein